jgi:hypothetical protein
LLAEWSESIAGPDLQRVLLALGVIASSLMAGDRRQPRFPRRDQVAAVREAAAAGRPEPVLAFVADVQALISAEHREWLLLLREIGADPARLRHASAIQGQPT